MTDWQFAQSDPSEEFAKLHLFSMRKRQPAGDVEFIITVFEYVNRNQVNMRFYARADKEVNLHEEVPVGVYRPGARERS